MRKALTSTLIPALIIATLCLTGCLWPARSNPAPAPVSATQESAALKRWPDATRSELDQGCALVTSACNKCHGHPLPADESVEKWPGLAERMAKKAQLDVAQTRAVIRYLVSAATVEPAR